MIGKNYHENVTMALKPFVEKLQIECYNAIESQCAEAKKQYEKITAIERSGEPLQFVDLCRNLISEVERQIKARKEIYIPYAHKLVEKVKDSHDCSNCQGGCKINHDMHVLELKASNDEMRKVLSRLQIMTLPLYSTTRFPDEYRVLKSNITLLETQLIELFFLENTYLIPKISEAQKTINAGSK